METHLIEWLDHPTVKEHKVGKRSKMGEAQATNQIAKGRAKLVVEEEEPKVFASTSRGKASTEKKKETEAGE